MDESRGTNKFIMCNKLNRYTMDPLTLKQLCSQRIVVMNYRYETRITPNRYTCKKGNSVFDFYRYYDLRIEDGLGLDKKIIKKVLDEDSILFFADKIDAWMNLNLSYYAYYDRNRIHHITNLLEDLVFNSSGSVSSLDTAKNLLIGYKLSLIEKYWVACINCMVDDINKLWRLVSTYPRVNVANKHPLIDYWTTVMKDEFQKLSGSDDDAIFTRIVIFKFGEWPAIEYILDQSTGDEQVESALYMMNNCAGITERSKMFLKLNNNEKLFREVMAKISLDELFGQSTYSKKWVPDVWNDMKNLINGDHFVDLILCSSFRRDHGRWDYSISDMWSSAPCHLKQYVINNVEIIQAIFNRLNERFTESCTDICYLDVQFFIDLLRVSSSKLKNLLWHKCWTKLIISAFVKPKLLDETMKLCFDNEEEIISFKESEMMNFRNIENFCASLIGSGCVRSLTDYLNICSTNADRIRTLKREIITSPRVQSAFLSWITKTKLILFDELIDSAFTSRDDAKIYKKGLIISSNELQEVYNQTGKKFLGVPWM